MSYSMATAVSLPAPPAQRTSSGRDILSRMLQMEKQSKVDQTLLEKKHGMLTLYMACQPLHVPQPLTHPCCMKFLDW